MADDGDDDKKACPEGDVISLGPDLGGMRPCIRHKEDHTVSLGFLCPNRGDGTDPPGEKDNLRRRGDTGDYDVEPTENGRASSGPAKVNSKAFKKNYDLIFGAKAPVGEA